MSYFYKYLDNIQIGRYRNMSLKKIKDILNDEYIDEYYKDHILDKIKEKGDNFNKEYIIYGYGRCGGMNAQDYIIEIATCLNSKYYLYHSNDEIDNTYMDFYFFLPKDFKIEEYGLCEHKEKFYKVTYDIERIKK